MSVLIKDMEMPRNCAECPFLYDGNACYAVNEPDSLFLPLVCNGRTGEYRVNEFPFHEKRVDWCPLVEVPTPVRHGKWECTYSPNGFLLEQKCSECGLTFEEPSGVDYNYCPQCGADMRGTEDD